MAPLLLYIGPGAGLGSIGAALTLLGAGLLMVVGLVWYPLRRLLERLRSPRSGRRAGAAPKPAEFERGDLPPGD